MFDRPYIIAVVEGCSDIWILECCTSPWGVALKQKLAFPNVLYPTNVSVDKNERLWVAGGPQMAQSDEVHLGVAELDGMQKICELNSENYLNYIPPHEMKICCL